MDGTLTTNNIIDFLLEKHPKQFTTYLDGEKFVKSLIKKYI